jgi:UTP--glucose-1-phosphate uridylyltransferase
VKEYVLTAEVFEELERTPPGQGGEIWLADALNRLAARGRLYAYEFEGRRYDVGNKQEFLHATIELALQRPDLGPALREYLRGLPLDRDW